MNLTAFQHSPFLQSLGWAIANSLWQAAALWITYQLVIGINKSASAKFKNNLSVILLCSSFVWFCITFLSKYVALQNFGNYDVALYHVNTAATAYNWNKILNNVAWILPYLSVAYLLLLVFFSVRLINIYRFTGFIKINGLLKPGVEWKVFTAKVARQMGITKNIKLWISRHIDVPATIGFLKPVILIPLASINRLSAHQLEAIILHELSHIKRNDYLINLFISIIETFLFFNPFIVLMARTIKRERENCCDDFVIQYQYDRHTYASALLSLEQYRSHNLKLAIGATSGKKQLLLRIKRIMEINNGINFNYGQKLVALLLITGVICSVAWLSPNHHNNNNNKTTVTVLDVPNTTDLNKINKVENFQALFENAPLSEEKPAVFKVRAKKAAYRSANQLREIKDLNSKELMALQNNRMNLLFEASKKQIASKKIVKLNINQLFAKGVNYLPSLFDIKFTDVAYGATFNQLNLSEQQKSIVELQRLQIDLNKAGFNFAFNAPEIEAAIKQAMNSKEVKDAFDSKKVKEFFNENLLTRTSKATEVKRDNESKINKTQQKAAAEKEQNRIYVSRIPKVLAHGGTQSSTVYIIDSLVSREIEVAEIEATRAATLIYRAQAASHAKAPQDANTVYSYGYSVNEHMNHVSKIQVQSVNTKSVRAKGGSKTVIIPDTRYLNHAPVTNCPPVKTIIPGRKTQPAKDIRIEYKNGVIVINGKKLELPEHEIVAISLKGKKVLAKAKNLMELYIEE